MLTLIPIMQSQAPTSNPKIFIPVQDLRFLVLTAPPPALHPCVPNTLVELLGLLKESGCVHEFKCFADPGVQPAQWDIILVRAWGWEVRCTWQRLWQGQVH